ncbi:Acyl-coenzyme A thioesterase 9, mitochondrial [Ascosphaera aggregata]|nr:Acyl-coenzyme A thioesterase 9, mitochondrial [Ascosphaera aggregata]
MQIRVDSSVRDTPGGKRKPTGVFHYTFCTKKDIQVMPQSYSDFMVWLDAKRRAQQTNAKLLDNIMKSNSLSTIHRGFASPIVDTEAEAARKRKEALDREIERVKIEYEEKMKRKAAEKAEQGCKGDEDQKGKEDKKDEDAKSSEKEKNDKACAPSSLGSDSTEWFKVGAALRLLTGNALQYILSDEAGSHTQQRGCKTE